MNDEKCPAGCIFDGERLAGDCRVPWYRHCYLNVRKLSKSQHKRIAVQSKERKDDT